MGKYIRKRLIQSIPVVFGITILTYFIMKLAPDSRYRIFPPSWI